MSHTETNVFYSLPARDITIGMSTADGQDVIDVSEPDDKGMVFVEVYTPADDPDEDEENRSGPETRYYPADEMIDMATFTNTDIDGSSLEDAVITLVDLAP